MKRIPGIKSVRIGNRIVALPDAQVRDLLKVLEKKQKKADTQHGNRKAEGRGMEAGL